jgi:hypothetical protein
MKQIRRGVLLALCVVPVIASADTYVQGYLRSDGTYVMPHYRTNPDATIYNNYSTRPNINPYTGKEGTVNPYSAPVPRNERPASSYLGSRPYQYQPYPYQPYSYSPYSR